VTLAEWHHRGTLITLSREADHYVVRKYGPGSGPDGTVSRWGSLMDARVTFDAVVGAAEVAATMAEVGT
jgi:hypothetical protein